MPDVDSEDDLDLLDVPITLDPSEVRDYDERGWMVIRNLLPEGLAHELREALTDAGQSSVEEYRRRASAQFQGAANVNVADRREMQHRVYVGLDNVSPLFSRAATSRRVVSVCQQLLRSDVVRYYRASVMDKPPQAEGGLDTGLHQDLPVLPFDRSGSLMIWIALGDVTPDMGPLRYVDGSHRSLPMMGRSNGRPDEQERIKKALGGQQLTEPLALGSGDATLHDDMTMHCAGVNESNQSRMALVIKYMRPDIRYTGAPHHVTNDLGLTANSHFDHENFPDFS